MNKLHEAVYIGSRNFCRMHPDIFVFSEFDSAMERVTLTIEYNGGFAIVREAKDIKNAYTFGPRVKKMADYSVILRAKEPHVVITMALSGMYKDMCDAFDLTFMEKWKGRLA